MEELGNELKEAAKLSKYLAKRNYILAYAVTLISVFASITAGILVALEGLNPAMIAAIASLPAAMMTFKTVFRFEQKSAWFWQKNKNLERLYRSLMYEEKPPAEVSKEFSQVESEMETDWVSFGLSDKKID
jgi:hypothetical protein